MPLASFGECTGYSIGRVVSSASISKAFARILWKTSKTRQSGSIESTQRYDMNVAKASFSQMPFHQRIVTRSPNHMCASSCAIVSATSSRSANVASASSISRSVSR